MSEHLSLRGTLEAHNGWVTSLATSTEQPDLLLSGSRDKTLIMWQLTREEGNFGFPVRSLTGHSHFVEDCVISADGQYALSASWDKSLRLWNLHTGQTTKTFLGHSKDVMSVAWSYDNRQIVSGSRDKTLKLWNILGECKFTITEEGHQDWVSAVTFSPNGNNPIIVSGGWDNVVKVWNLTNCKLQSNLVGHAGYVNAVTVSPDGTLCATGGKDGVAMLWDLEESKHLYTLQPQDEGKKTSYGVLHALAFSPARFWLVGATTEAIILWDLQDKCKIQEIRPEFVPSASGKGRAPECVSLAWSSDGTTLFSGWTDNKIRVYSLSSN